MSPEETDLFKGVAGDWRTIRGRTVALCMMNELAFWRDETSSNPDKEILTRTAYRQNET
jgi:hypothetical protein